MYSKLNSDIVRQTAPFLLINQSLLFKYSKAIFRLKWKALRVKIKQKHETSIDLCNTLEISKKFAFLAWYLDIKMKTIEIG